MAEITTISSNDYEEIAVWRDPDADLTAAAAIHSTVRGPAIGGTRWLPYAGLDEALTDVRRLAEAMTLKSATARLPFGGGKAVVLGDPAEKTDAQLRSYAEFVNHFEGRFLTTTDVGTTTAEVDQLAQWTPHMVGKSKALGGSGDTSALTATTVLAGIAATLEALDGDPSADGRRIVILGVGKVGSRVARALAEQGARLLLADIRAVGAAALAAELGAQTVSVDAAMTTPCDLFSPNALGGLLNAETIPYLQARSICGAANNQLDRDPQDAELLAEHGVLYAPDYVVNSGGVISVTQEVCAWSYEQAHAHAEAVYETTAEIFTRAQARAITPATAALDFAEEQLAAATTG